MHFVAALVLATTLVAPTNTTEPVQRVQDRLAHETIESLVRLRLAHEFVAVEDYVPEVVASVDLVEELVIQEDDATTVVTGADLVCSEECEAKAIATTIDHATATGEDWRPVLEIYFPASEINTAIRVIDCESGGKTTAKNPTSTASGLFQMLKGWWNGTWNFDPFDPVENIRHAAMLQAADGWSTHWYPSEGCWG